MEIDCPYTTLWITAQDNDWDHFYVHATTEQPKDGAEWVGFFRDAHGMEGFLRGMQLANDKMLAELSYTKAENERLRAQLADLQRIIKYIDKKFPRADETCDEPGITLSEAVRRTLAEQ